MNKLRRRDMLVFRLTLILSISIVHAQDPTQGLKAGESNAYRVVAGAIGTEAGKGNSSTYNITIHGNDQPYGRGNSTSYNASIGYLYVLDRTQGAAPTLVINFPTNDSTFGEIFLKNSNITLNVTVTDPDNSVVDLYIFGANTTGGLDAGNNSLLAIFRNVNATAAGFNGTYNWTSPVITPDTARNKENGTILIMHFDNRSEHGENDSRVYDFSGNGNIGNCTGTECPGYNFTSSIFGGSLNFDGTDDNINVTTISGTFTAFTVVWWIYPHSRSNWNQQIKAHNGWGAFAFHTSNIGEVYVGTDTDTRFTPSDLPSDTLVLNEWQHFTYTYDGAQGSFYKNGALLAGPKTQTSPSAFGSFIIGESDSNTVDGKIDEVAIWNRSLSAEEVRDLYKLKSSKYFFKANVTESDTGFRAQTETRELLLNRYFPRINSSINNTAPRINYTINISANVTDDYNLSKCSFIHNQSGTITIVNKTVTETNDQCSTHFNITVPRANAINFTVIAYDSANNTNQSEHIIEVENTPPPRAVALLPRTNNVTTNRTPTFTWINITDADNDTLTFNLDIKCVVCSVDNRNHNITAQNYTLVTPLEFLNDDNYFYNWTVRANDGLTYGEYSNASNLTINSLVSITMPNNSIDFGSMSLGQENSTHRDVPEPFTVENDGNVHVNVTIRANQSMWLAEGIPNESFQYKVDNLTGEEYSFIYEHENSTINWTNITTDERLSIVNLSYQDANDTAEIDIKVIVPLDEPTGTRSSKIILEASY